MTHAIDKFCTKCLDTYPSEKFYKNRSSIDGLSRYCKECQLQYTKNKEKSGFLFQKQKQRRLKNLRIEDQPKKIQEIAQCFFDNPKVSCEEVMQKTGLAASTIRNYMANNDYLISLRRTGAQKVTQMIPQAIETLNGSLLAKSEDVKLKASIKILENENILGPEKMEITVSPYANKSSDELAAMIMKLEPPLKQTIEAEIVE